MSGPSPLLRPPLPTAHAAERWRVLATLMAGRASARRELSDALHLRSTSVSDHVGHLVASGLVVESHRPSGGRGRPSGVLIANPHRLAAVVYQVESQSIAASCVNLAGQELARVSRHVPPQADNADMAGVLGALLDEVTLAAPTATELAGISFSLSGVLDAEARRWLFSSRWPALRDFDAAAAVGPRGLPVSVARNLDVELSARLAHAQDTSGGTLLVHWGWGIGAAYAVAGVPVNGAAGRFGEIGHWRMGGEARPCRCGGIGCLETVAGLWACGEGLREAGLEVPTDEHLAGLRLRDARLFGVPCFERAFEAMVVSLGNLCRVLFPRRVIVSGPFVANAAVWSSLREALAREGTLPGVPAADLQADQRSRELEREGAAAAPLNTALARLLA
ncbi:transcriptional regulator of PTS gene [Chelatococcus caeni]|uniref:Transcriptional regulator of PTS protein n=1 Tax=Chelatococcus caeni TaxID=1348468 RepID=A0A840C3U0_9HYPH|nr:ROK family transcriptional regulator [Chelatococcus caeni]MBB4019513.1 transcriptional regulator of PTS gene [Chelatococcus caeni]